jgi:hypothetical protein
MNPFPFPRQKVSCDPETVQIFPPSLCFQVFPQPTDFQSIQFNSLYFPIFPNGFFSKSRLIAQLFSFSLLPPDPTFHFVDSFSFNSESMWFQFPFPFYSKTSSKCPLLISVTFKKGFLFELSLQSK